MPTLSFGNTVKTRATQMLYALMAYANQEIPNCPIEFEARLVFKDNCHQLKVRNVHQENHLLELVRFFISRDECECLNKDHIQRNFFEQLGERGLNILQDESQASQKKRYGLWCFSIQLWSQDVNENLEQFSQYWEEYKNNQSQSNRFTDNQNLVIDFESKQTAFLSQDLSELLFLLNCIQQENAFRAARATANPAGTFLVRAKNLSLQKWLVNRLVRSVPGYENAYCQPFNAYSPEIRLNFNLLWEKLATELNISATIDNVTKALIERCCCQTVILVLYGVHKLKSDQIAQFMKFWKQLVQGIQARRDRDFRSRLVLFLVEDTEEHQYPFYWVRTIEPQCLEIPLILSPLSQISKAEALTWLSLNEVYEKLTQIMSQEQVNLLLQDIDVPNPNEVSITLDEICFTCGLENGIAEIEQYWKLSA